jgi:effector-binding domain-containing protein
VTRIRPYPVAFLSLLVLLSCTAPVTVDTVLDRAEEAMGGSEALAGVTGFRMRASGTWEGPALGMPPMPYESELVLQLPDKVYLEIRPEMAEPMIMAYDGQEAWGAWMAPPARYQGWLRDMTLELLAELKVLFIAPVRSTEPEALSLEDPRPEGEPPAHRVLYTPASGGTWTLWFDQASGRLVRGEHPSRYFADSRPMEGRWQRSEPREFGGIVLASRARFEGSREGQLLEVVEETIEEIEWNPEIPPGFFSPREPGFDLVAVGTKEIPPAAVVTLRHTGSYQGIGETLARLEAGVGQAGLMAAGRPWGTYHNIPGQVPEEELVTDLSLPVMPAGEPPELPEGFRYETLPALEVAFAYHRGDHRGEGEAHGRVMAWLHENRKIPAGPPRAVWFHEPETTVTEDLITEVQYPVR